MKKVRLSENYMTKQPARCIICQTTIHRWMQAFDCEVDGLKGVAHSLCDSPYNTPGKKEMKGARQRSLLDYSS